MLNPVYYIVDADLLPELPSGTGDVYALRVAADERDKLQVAYKAIEALSSNASVCLYLTVAQQVEEQYLFDLVAFFFLPCYYKKGNVPVVIVAHEYQKEFKTFSQALIGAAQKQGFAQLVLHFVRQQQKENQTFYSAHDIEALKTGYTNELKDSSGKPFYIVLNNAHEIKVLHEALQNVEATFAQDNEMLYACKTKGKALERKLQQTETLLDAAEKEIETMTAHLNKLRSASQAASLQQYYTNEYEVLPRWYKQFGHVLKVVMGKRTFGSLFNDKEKKYKS